MAKIPQTFFDERVMVVRLKEAFIKAIPPDTDYHTINLALAEVLADFLKLEYEDEMMGKRKHRVARLPITRDSLRDAGWTINGNSAPSYGKVLFLIQNPGVLWTLRRNNDKDPFIAQVDNMQDLEELVRIMRVPNAR